MQLIRDLLGGCLELSLPYSDDSRGRFVKVFHEPAFRQLALETVFLEDFYSISARGVLRGLHFQRPPHDGVKLVHCVSGRVFDVVVDLRADSATYGRHACIELDGQRASAVYIPRGFAHGFQALTDDAVVGYKVGMVHAPDFDTGIRWDSLGIAWPLTHPLVSERDRRFAGFKDFCTPFKQVTSEQRHT